jgi:hypothetical protein
LNPDKPQTLPHPDDIAARKALAKRPPASLESVRIQLKASEEWRRKHFSSTGSETAASFSQKKIGVH